MNSVDPDQTAPGLHCFKICHYGLEIAKGSRIDFSFGITTMRTTGSNRVASFLGKSCQLCLLSVLFKVC